MSTTLRFFLPALLLVLGAAPIIAQDAETPAAPAPADAEPEAATIPQLPVPTFAVGERFLTGGSMSQQVTISMGPRDVAMVEMGTRKAENKVLAIDDAGLPSRVWVKVHDYTESATMDGRERPGALQGITVAGRTFIVTRGADGDDPTIIDAETEDAVSPQIASAVSKLADVDGDADDLVAALPKRDLTVGEKIELDADKMGSLAPEGVSDATVFVTVLGTEANATQSLVVLKLDATFSAKPEADGPPMSMTLKASGKLWIDAATGRPAKMDVAGKMTFAGQVQGAGTMTMTRFSTPLPADETGAGEAEPSDDGAETITVPLPTAVVGMTITSAQKVSQTMSIDLNGTEMTVDVTQTFTSEMTVLAVKDGVPVKARMKITAWEIEQTMDGEGMGPQDGPLAGRTVIIERKGELLSVTHETGEPIEPMFAAALEQQLQSTFGKQHPISERVANKPLKIGKAIRIDDEMLSSMVPAGAGLTAEDATLKPTGTKEHNGEKVAVFEIRMKLSGSPDGLAGAAMKMTATGTMLVSIANGHAVRNSLGGKITLSGQINGSGDVKAEVDLTVTMPTDSADAPGADGDDAGE
jgi:hypothetical protein